ncbi:MAG: T9SS type A sorting domain-containing protein [Bacteroidota bacterium]
MIIETPTAIPSILINIYDMQGRIMQQVKESKAEGKAIFTIPSYKLAKGKYTVTVYDAQKRIGTVKIVKL